MRGDYSLPAMASTDYQPEFLKILNGKNVAKSAIIAQNYYTVGQLADSAMKGNFYKKKMM